MKYHVWCQRKGIAEWWKKQEMAGKMKDGVPPAAPSPTLFSRVCE